MDWAHHDPLGKTHKKMFFSSNVASWKVVRFQAFQKLIIFYGFQLDCQCLNILANTEGMVPNWLKKTSPLENWHPEQFRNGWKSKHFLQIVGENEGWKSRFQIHRTQFWLFWGIFGQFLMVYTTLKTLTKKVWHMVGKLWSRQFFWYQMKGGYMLS